MKLTELTLTAKSITKGTDAVRSMKSLIRINNLPSAEFWKNYDAGEYK